MDLGARLRLKPHPVVLTLARRDGRAGEGPRRAGLPALDRDGGAAPHHAVSAPRAARDRHNGGMSPTWIWMQSILAVFIVASIVIAITKLT
ncbi:hypothetical protein NBH00_20985 [Paraconexibacter antarcticus]|uniref:Uncharacterized protein n=1 Tax=Paraconexibacter antarcticus TaxID=2949664 RepID=A0ABY5DQ59_9ACTN|nr:hypothetical protein [Paraconexibacter antarcticus]UTI63806.1 hypothetical protein NBH00_20985 [Paraconexibacter antarcticus]